MTHRLATNYAKNYCNRTLIVKVIVENVVTCFLGTRCTIHGSVDRTRVPTNVPYWPYLSFLFPRSAIYWPKSTNFYTHLYLVISIKGGAV